MRFGRGSPGELARPGLLKLAEGSAPGRVVEQVRIDEPYPRTPDFMVSPQFSRYARQLQDSLLRASADSEEVVSR